MASENRELIWGNLLHLGYNMWSDREMPERDTPYICAKPYLRFDEPLWRDLLKQMAGQGLNTVVLDLGEGLRYDSHPELAVQGSWSPAKLAKELAFVRDVGLEPIPKLNFSACHDAWLGEYARCVSTPTYYAVCRDLIAEVCELFDTPRFFHLGMDEETAEHQRYYGYVLIRQYDLWWHDLYLLLDAVEKRGVRPWVWSDYVWHHPKTFLEKMPKSVLQSNWYYQTEFGPDIQRANAYDLLEEHGYDQVPTGSNWVSPENMRMTVDYATSVIDKSRLYGFLQTPWKPTLMEVRQRHEAAITQLGDARKRYLQP